MDTLIEVLRGAIAPFGLGALALWFIKKLISEALARDTEKYKGDLKAASDMQLEQLKSKLQLNAVEHQVRFSNLHEKRAEVIAEVYTLLYEVYTSTSRFVNNAYPTDPAHQDKYVAEYDRLFKVYELLGSRRIYLPEATFIQTDEYVEQLRKIVIRVGILGKSHGISEPDPGRPYEAQINALNEFNATAHNMLADLIAEFRRLLGDTPHPALANRPLKRAD